MAFRSRPIGRDRLQMLRSVLDTAASSMGVLRGTREHEQLAVRVLQLADVILDREHLLAALGGGTRFNPTPGTGRTAAEQDRVMH
jgi:hypothetical protein